MRRQQISQQDVRDALDGVSPMARLGAEQARKECLAGKTEPSAAMLRVSDLFGTDYIEAYVRTWMALIGRAWKN